MTDSCFNPFINEKHQPVHRIDMMTAKITTIKASRLVIKSPIGVPKVPYINKKNGDWYWTEIWNVLNQERIIFLTQPINEELGNQLLASMLFINGTGEQDIKLYINFTGGELVPCFSLLDTIRHIKSDVATVGFGGCLGTAGFLLSMGQKSKRYALSNTRIMINHPSGTARGQASDIHREALELLKIRDLMDHLIAEQSGKPVDRVSYDLRRNLYMTPDDAVEYGIIDSILLPSSKNKCDDSKNIHSLNT